MVVRQFTFPRDSRSSMVSLLSLRARRAALARGATGQGRGRHVALVVVGSGFFPPIFKKWHTSEPHLSPRGYL